jgi:hypothetical protein
VFHSRLDEDLILVERDAVSIGEWRPKFQGIVLSSLQGLTISPPQKNYLNLNTKELRTFETSGSTCWTTRRHIPVEMCFQHYLLHKMKTGKPPDLTANV